MDKPEVYCQFCYQYQPYEGQEFCRNCHGRFSNWHLARQLQKVQPQVQTYELRKV